MLIFIIKWVVKTKLLVIISSKEAKVIYRILKKVLCSLFPLKKIFYITIFRLFHPVNEQRTAAYQGLWLDGRLRIGLRWLDVGCYDLYGCLVVLLVCWLVAWLVKLNFWSAGWRGWGCGWQMSTTAGWRGPNDSNQITIWPGVNQLK